MSMRERASSIGAALDIVSRPGSGTAIVVERRNDEIDLVPEAAVPEELEEIEPEDADLDEALYHEEVEYAGVDEEQPGS
jgi:hypothetical protein